ncbi:MAG: hypothetical protein JWN21_2090 [Sphingomonas bacterium]|uniref:hypothetical protein n=1 Tax=Sphingomonas bacterium TaxID=1895847 RepID=UPI0026191B0F|nr:hypothetical protein [Sphingomonas bacterium]MDB5696547.1 hypothetical protein [Sphingomonas bacterium]
MTKFIAALTIAAALLPAGVAARGPDQRFTRDGMTYVYSVSPAAGGRQVIQGRRLPGNSSFRLVVKGNRVAGTSGGQPVSFRVPVAAPAVLAAR